MNEPLVSESLLQLMEGVPMGGDILAKLWSVEPEMSVRNDKYTIPESCLTMRVTVVSTR